MKQPYSDRFNIPLHAETKRLKKQAACSHPICRRVCSICNKQMADLPDLSTELTDKDLQPNEILL